MNKIDSLGCAYCSGLGLVQHYVCNICGEKNPVSDLIHERDFPSCYSCGSTLRVRSVIRVLSIELFKKSLVLRDFPRGTDIFGLGMTDWDNYASILARKLNYINTFYDQEPRLDITNKNIPFKSSLDFLISSDVFEHVAPPISTAFANSFELLKNNGVFIFSVPYVAGDGIREYYPNLHNYKIVEQSGERILKNTTASGEEEIFKDLVFHGCDALEMRQFSESSIVDSLADAGFGEIIFYDDADYENGIAFKTSLPEGAVTIAARKLQNISGGGPKVIKRSNLAESTNFLARESCLACDGTGIVGLASLHKKCARCDGKGSIQSGRCPDCTGLGWVEL